MRRPHLIPKRGDVELKSNAAEIARGGGDCYRNIRRMCERAGRPIEDVKMFVGHHLTRCRSRFGSAEACDCDPVVEIGWHPRGPVS